MRIFRNAVMHCSTNVHLTVGAKECALLKPPMFAADLIFFCVCVLGCFYVVLNLIAIWTYKFMRLANATMFACYIGMMCRLQSRRYKWFIEHNMSHCKLNLSIIVCPVAYFFVMCSSLVEAWIMLCVLGCCMAWPAIVAGIRCKKLHEKRLTACLRYVSLC